MSWGQPKECTCRWEGDDHYNHLAESDPNCPVHDEAFYKRLEEQKETMRLRDRVSYLEEQATRTRVRAMTREELVAYLVKHDTSPAGRLH